MKQKANFSDSDCFFSPLIMPGTTHVTSSQWENHGEYPHTENQVHVLGTQDKAIGLQCLYDLLWLKNTNNLHLEINLLHVIFLSNMST